MKKEKIAVLTDSGNNISKNKSDNLFVLPLSINIGDETYIDGETINLEEVLDRLDDNKITTSLPGADIIIKTLDEIKKQNYTHVIINTISSGLSGTYNFIRVLAQDYKGLDIALIDTKNISIASGYTSYLALEAIEEGKSFAEIVEKLENSLDHHKVFFVVGSVEYLRRGGRIGLVAATVANLLSIKPVITCNENGVYHTVSKTRGYQKAIKKMIDAAHNFINEHKIFDVSILVAKIDEKTQEAIALFKEVFKKAHQFEIIPVSPSLAIHTGPQALGIALRIRD